MNPLYLSTQDCQEKCEVLDFSNCICRQNRGDTNYIRDNRCFRDLNIGVQSKAGQSVPAHHGEQPGPVIQGFYTQRVSWIISQIGF